MAGENRLSRHAPVAVMVGVVAAVFLVSMFLYQVPVTKYAVVKRLGKPQLDRDTSPGLHFRLPWPIEKIWTVPNTVSVFEGKAGEIEEVLTVDGKNTLIGIYLGWRVDQQHAVDFMQAVNTPEQAEVLLTGLLRNFKHGVISRYNFSDLVNVDPNKVKISVIEQEILKEISSVALAQYGIQVTMLGIKHIGLPQSTTNDVYERMRAERKRFADQVIAEGKSRADEIRAEADNDRKQVIAKAEEEAQRIRGEGDAEAALSYKTFAEDPELAIFLRQLTALRKSLQGKTTLVLDTTNPPFNMFQGGALEKLNRRGETVPLNGPLKERKPETPAAKGN